MAVHEGVVSAAEVLVSPSPDQLDAGDTTFAQKVFPKSVWVLIAMSWRAAYMLFVNSKCCVFATRVCALNIDNEWQLDSQMSGGDREARFHLRCESTTHAKASLAEEGCGSAMPHNGLVIDGWSLPILT